MKVTASAAAVLVALVATVQVCIRARFVSRRKIIPRFWIIPRKKMSVFSREIRNNAFLFREYYFVIAVLTPINV